MGRDLVRVSKLLSKHLRHDPGGLGLVLGPGGWVAVEAVLAGCARKGVVISRAQLEEVVASSDKQRFALSADRREIRANQGHSVAVDLQLEAAGEVPATLFHGTAQASVAAILREGLRRMGRHHVHLSAEVETARKVGGRHGPPVVLAVDTAAMVAEGAVFYVSENGVWLTDTVAPQHLRRVL